MINRKQLKADAKTRLSNNYWKAVLVALIMAVISGGSAYSSNAGSGSSLRRAAQTFSAHGGHYLDGAGNCLIAAGVGTGVVAFLVALALLIFLFNPLEVGGDRFFVGCGDTGIGDLSALGYSFMHDYGHIAGVMFFKWLYTFLWSLLFVIPGIVKSYEYMMIPYLLAENPDMTKDTAFETSRTMMDGHKMDAFVLDLSFIGWHLLGVITFGIVEIFWVGPYYYQTRAEFYRAIRDDYKTRFNPYGNSGYNPYTWA